MKLEHVQKPHRGWSCSQIRGKNGADDRRRIEIRQGRTSHFSPKLGATIPRNIISFFSGGGDFGHALKISILTALFAPIEVFGQEVTYNLLEDVSSVQGNPTLTEYVAGAIGVIIGVAGILAVVKIVLCGFKVVTSPSPSTREDARKCLLQAIIGLLLALAAWLILQTINPQLLELREIAPLPDAPDILPIETVPGWYYEYRAARTGRSARSQRYDTQAACQQAESAYQAESGVEILRSCYEIAPTGVTGENGVDCPVGSVCRWSTGSICAQDPACPPLMRHTRITGPNTACGGTQPAGSACCVYTEGVCPTCVILTVPTNSQYLRATPTINARLEGLLEDWPRTYPGWRVTEGFTNTVAHCSNDEVEGRSVDIAFTSTPNPTHVREFISTGLRHGLRVVFETCSQATRDRMVNGGVWADSVLLLSCTHITGDHFSVYH